MLFKDEYSVPANTTSSSPVHRKLKIIPGTIKQWIIFSDPEAANLLKIRVFYQSKQILPFSPDQWLTAFFDNRPFDEDITIIQPPLELDIYAYNDDDTFPHEYYIHAIIIRKDALKLPDTDEEISAFWQQFLEGGP